MDKHLLQELQHITNSMFSKNYFGIFHGSISAKTDIHAFVINKKDTILDNVNEETFIRLTSNTRRDYRWKDASEDSEIHLQIYKNLPNAKYISYTMPPYATAYALEHSVVKPKDYYGYSLVNDVHVYDPGSFDDWEERAPYEISSYFKEHSNHLLLIKGFGLITYDRDLLGMAKKAAILENSCRLLSIQNS